MDELSTVAGWTVFQHEDRLYVRLEQVIAALFPSTPEQRRLLAFMLHIDGVSIAEAPEDGGQ